MKSHHHGEKNVKKLENARLVLDELLQEHRKALPADIEDSEHFELFVSEQVLRAYKLENEEINSGIVAGGNDGQIDSMYLFVNGNLLQGDVEEKDLTEYRKNIVLDLVIIQSKRTPSQKLPFRKWMTRFQTCLTSRNPWQN